MLPTSGGSKKTTSPSASWANQVMPSVAMSPSLGYGIGMAYLPVEKAEPGTQIEIDVRGRTRTAEVREKPLYTKETS